MSGYIPISFGCYPQESPGEATGEDGTLPDEWRDCFSLEQAIICRWESYEEFRHRILCARRYESKRSLNRYNLNSYEKLVKLSTDSFNGGPTLFESGGRERKLGVEGEWERIQVYETALLEVARGEAARIQDEVDGARARMEWQKAEELEGEMETVAGKIRQLTTRLVDAQAGVATYEAIVTLYVQRFLAKEGNGSKGYDLSLLRMIALILAVKTACDTRLSTKRDFDPPFHRAPEKEISFVQAIDWDLSVDMILKPETNYTHPS